MVSEDGLDGARDVRGLGLGADVESCANVHHPLRVQVLIPSDGRADEWNSSAQGGGDTPQPCVRDHDVGRGEKRGVIDEVSYDDVRRTSQRPAVDLTGS